MTHGQFLIKDELPLNQVDWGKVGFFCGPGTTSSKQLMVGRGQFLPGKGHAFHMHPSQEEVIFVVSGVIEQWIEEEKRVLGPGDAVFLPAGTVHASFNAGEGEAELLAIFGWPVGETGLESVEVAHEAPWRDLRP